MLFGAGYSCSGMANSIVVKNGMLYHLGARVTALTDVISVVVEGRDVLALTREGHVYRAALWGSGGPDYDPPPYLPVTYMPERRVHSVFDPVPVYEIAMGWDHIIACLDNGMVVGAGNNQLGCLAEPQRTRAYEYRGNMSLISGGSLEGISVVGVAAGENSSGAIDAAGGVHLCGGNYDMQLGLGHTQPCHAWTQSTVLSAVATLSVGAHGAAVTADGDLWTWGSNWCGQLGHGDTTARATPERVGGLADKVLSAACGASHTLFVSKSHDVFSAGQCSDPVVELDNTVFTVVDGLPKMAQVAVSDLRCAALSRDGRVFEWGYRGGGFGPAPVLQLPHAVPMPPTMQCAGVSLAAQPRRTTWMHGHAVVFAMVAHRRLGAASAYSGLSTDLVDHVLWICGLSESLSMRRRRGVW